MGQESGWGDRVGARVAAAVRHHRERRGLTTIALSRRCTDLGWPVSRSKIANLESGERANVTLPELFVLAHALAVPPAALLFPGAMDDPVEVLPDVTLSTLDAVSWVAAADFSMPPGLPAGSGDNDYHHEVAAHFWLARMQAERVAEIDAARDHDPVLHRDALDDLNDFLDQMDGVGLSYRLPTLPERITEELATRVRPPSSRLIPPDRRRTPRPSTTTTEATS